MPYDQERAQLERRMRIAQLLGGQVAQQPPVGGLGSGLARGIAQAMSMMLQDKQGKRLDELDAGQRQADIAALQGMQTPDIATLANIRTPEIQQLAAAMASRQPPKRQIVTGPDGNSYFADTQEPVLPNVKPDPATTVTPRQTFEQKQQEIKLREMEANNRLMLGKSADADRDARLEFDKKEADRQRGKLSAASEKALIGYQDAYFAAGKSAGELETLASEWERSKPTAGVAGTFEECVKRMTGEQNGDTLIRKRFIGVRNSQVVKNLPPGVASDRDIQIAMEGYPTDTTNPETMAAFLRGMAKLERYNEDFNDFAAGYVDKNNGTRGMVDAWKARFGQSGSEAAALENMSDDDLIKALQ